MRSYRYSLSFSLPIIVLFIFRYSGVYLTIGNGHRSERASCPSLARALAHAHLRRWSSVNLPARPRVRVPANRTHFPRCGCVRACLRVCVCTCGMLTRDQLERLRFHADELWRICVHQRSPRLGSLRMRRLGRLSSSGGRRYLGAPFWDSHLSWFATTFSPAPQNVVIKRLSTVELTECGIRRFRTAPCAV